MSAIVEQALGLSYGATKGEDDWNLWLDENLIKIGAVAQISVASMSEDTPPGVFVEGRRVIVGPSPTGAYAGQAGKLTVGVEGDYKFYTILKGWDFYNEADGKRYTWSGSAFVDPVAAGITGKQSNILFKEDGTSLGTTGTVTAINFTGPGVTASRVGDALTVAIPGGTVDAFAPVVDAGVGSGNYDLTSAHAGQFIKCAPASEEDTITVRVPSDTTDAIPVSTEIHILQDDAGTVQIDRYGTGTAPNFQYYSGTTGGVPVLLGKWAVVTLKKLSADNWAVFGALEVEA